MATAPVNDVIMQSGATEHLQTLVTTGTSKASVSLSVQSIAANGVLTGWVQGSNDQGLWFDLNTSANGDIKWSQTVDGSAGSRGTTTPVVIGGWAFLRMRWSLTVAGPVVFSSILGTSL